MYVKNIFKTAEILLSEERTNFERKTNLGVQGSHYTFAEKKVDEQMRELKNVIESISRYLNTETNAAKKLLEDVVLFQKKQNLAREFLETISPWVSKYMHISSPVAFKFFNVKCEEFAAKNGKLFLLKKYDLQKQWLRMTEEKKQPYEKFAQEASTMATKEKQQCLREIGNITRHFNQQLLQLENKIGLDIANEEFEQILDQESLIEEILLFTKKWTK